MANTLPKILIVDDESINREILAAVFGTHYATMLAKNGEEALECVLRPGDRPDLILLDIDMPGMDGYELCRILKADAAARDIPIIFITAMNGDASEARGLELGGVDYVSKSSKIPVLLARVRTHLELSAAYQALKVESQKREEAQRMQAAAELREAIRMREEVDRIMRHDLKGPLSAIIAVPGLITEVGVLNEAQKALMQTVEESGYRLLDMINRSLDMHKMELGVYTLRAAVIFLETTREAVNIQIHNRGCVPITI